MVRADHMYSCGQMDAVDIGEDHYTTRLTLKAAKSVILIVKPNEDVENLCTECIRYLLLIECATYRHIFTKRCVKVRWG